ncbi:MAG TPA: hypothetical protein VN752_09870 [Solirubrobacterales bacterium]|nr:hypothetical protein [Solirubrobacterales bacterium]
MMLLLATPGGAAGGSPNPAHSLEVPPPAVPMRDVVLGEQGAGAARISASASSQRYSIGDGTEATIAVSVTEACAASCEVTNPQRVASFIGSLVHGPEVELLTVQLDTEFQLGFDCGFGAEACYFVGENRIVIGGYEAMDGDSATFEFVLAHEYGHHVAAHREIPAPFGEAVDWGTARWASWENVCRGQRTGRLFPGDEAESYFENPGEAFAESFAHNRFPELSVRWRYLSALKPTPRALQAIRKDTLLPWQGRSSFVLSGRVPARGEGAAVESLRTPLDGMVSLRPVSLRRHGYELALRSRAGRLLRSSTHGLGPQRQLDFTVCGQTRLRLVITSRGNRPTPFRLLIQRP